MTRNEAETLIDEYEGIEIDMHRCRDGGCYEVTVATSPDHVEYFDDYESANVFLSVERERIILLPDVDSDLEWKDI